MSGQTSEGNDHPLSGSPVLNIGTDAEGIVVERPNRFLCVVDIVKPEQMKSELVHVHDPGRLVDIVYPGNRVLLRKASSVKRKTAWDLIAGDIKGEWVLVNSAWHRKISEWVLDKKIIPFLSNIDTVIPEQKFGDSRLDFLLRENERSFWVEVKGCTLAIDGVALFPDAPTVRGKRHLEELIKARDEGHEAVIMILVFRQDAHSFAPNGELDPEFSQTFRKAVDSGVKVFPIQFSFENNTIVFQSILPVFENK